MKNEKKFVMKERLLNFKMSAESCHFNSFNCNSIVDMSETNFISMF